MTAVIAWLTGLSRSQLVLRGIVALGLPVGLLASGPAGRWAPPWLVLGVLVIGIVAAVLPESPVVLTGLVLVMAWWTAALDDVLAPGLLAAVVALVATHVAATLAAYGPGHLPVDRRLLGRWAARGLGVALVAPVVWGFARLVEGEPAEPGVWPAGVAAGLAAVLLAGAFYGTSQGEDG